MKKKFTLNNVIAFHLFFLLLVLYTGTSSAQNSMIGDGFGGRSWYVPHNFQAGAYSANTVCGTDSQLYSWGRNLYGELGDGTTINSDTPVKTIGMNHVKFYTTGYISAAIKNDNSAWVWGLARITSGFSGFTTTPALVLQDVKFADGGGSHVVFVKNDGTVWGAGQNTLGQLGNGTTSPMSNPVTVPVQMTGITNAVRAVALGYGSSYPSATMILLQDSTVKLTGGSPWFAATNSTIPVTVDGLTNIVDIKGGATAAYALNAAGEVYVFGKQISATNSVLGIDTPFTGAYISPTKIIFPAGAAPIVALSANNDGYSALALDENSNVYAWGVNQRGLLGDGTYVNRNTPVLTATNVIDIYSGETFSYILKADSTLWATGSSKDTTGSIWMNLEDIKRNVFTQIDPTIAPMNLCAPVPFGVVPVRLIHFTCTVNNTVAKLSWESAGEINFDKYIIEYSADGKNFTDVSTVVSKSIAAKYSYAYPLRDNIAFFRLRLVDKDGRFTYSAIRSVKVNTINTLSIAPNPSNNAIYIYGKAAADVKTIEIVTVNGSRVKTINNFNSGQGLNISSLSKGTYILKCVDKNENTVYLRFIKM